MYPLQNRYTVIEYSVAAHSNCTDSTYINAVSDAVPYRSMLGHCLDLRGSKLGGSSVAQQNGFLQERLQVLGYQGGRGEQSGSVQPAICTDIHTPGHWRLCVHIRT